ncbi:hypothetical protein SNEBB_008271 [Seison nebaliae]|nr:hypothetical protein SNEBB_008271 [Seison nebaliae]
MEIDLTESSWNNSLSPSFSDEGSPLNLSELNDLPLDNNEGNNSERNSKISVEEDNSFHIVPDSQLSNKSVYFNDTFQSQRSKKRNIVDTILLPVTEMKTIDIYKNYVNLCEEEGTIFSRKRMRQNEEMTRINEMEMMTEKNIELWKSAESRLLRCFPLPVEEKSLDIIPMNTPVCEKNYIFSQNVLSPVNRSIIDTKSLNSTRNSSQIPSDEIIIFLSCTDVNKNVNLGIFRLESGSFEFLMNSDWTNSTSRNMAKLSLCELSIHQYMLYLFRSANVREVVIDNDEFLDYLHLLNGENMRKFNHQLSINRQTNIDYDLSSKHDFDNSFSISNSNRSVSGTTRNTSNLSREHFVESKSLNVYCENVRENLRSIVSFQQCYKLTKNRILIKFLKMFSEWDREIKYKLICFHSFHNHFTFQLDFPLLSFIRVISSQYRFNDYKKVVNRLESNRSLFGQLRKTLPVAYHWKLWECFHHIIVDEKILKEKRQFTRIFGEQSRDSLRMLSKLFRTINQFTQNIRLLKKGNERMEMNIHQFHQNQRERLSKIIPNIYSISLLIDHLLKIFERYSIQSFINTFLYESRNYLQKMLKDLNEIIKIRLLKNEKIFQFQPEGNRQLVELEKVSSSFDEIKQMIEQEEIDRSKLTSLRMIYTKLHLTYLSIDTNEFIRIYSYDILKNLQNKFNCSSTSPLLASMDECRTTRSSSRSSQQMSKVTAAPTERVIQTQPTTSRCLSGRRNSKVDTEIELNKQKFLQSIISIQVNENEIYLMNKKTDFFTNFAHETISSISFLQYEVFEELTKFFNDRYLVLQLINEQIREIQIIQHLSIYSIDENFTLTKLHPIRLNPSRPISTNVKVKGIFELKECFIPSSLLSISYTDELIASTSGSKSTISPDNIPITIDQDEKISFLTGPSRSGKTEVIRRILFTIFLHQLGTLVSCLKESSISIFDEIRLINGKKQADITLSSFNDEVGQYSTIFLNRIDKKNRIIFIDEPFTHTTMTSAEILLKSVIDYFLEIDRNSFVFIATRRLAHLLDKYISNPFVQYATMNVTGQSKKNIYNFAVQSNEKFIKISHTNPVIYPMAATTLSLSKLTLELINSKLVIETDNRLYMSIAKDLFNFYEELEKDLKILEKKLMENENVEISLKNDLSSYLIKVDKRIPMIKHSEMILLNEGKRSDFTFD